MNSRRPFGGRSSPRQDASSWFEDDDDEPFEQDPPGSAAHPPFDSPSSASPAILSGDTVESVRSSEARALARAARAVGDASKPKRSLRGRALGYLSRREHSRSELARKLAPFVEESDGEGAVDALLDALGREGWLSDSRFAESVVNRRASRFGASRIVGELKRHGLDSDLVQELSANLRDTEWDRVRSVWAKKFGRLAETPAERAKQARFLASRGFSRDAIMRVLRLGDDELPGDD